jgi:hypothetical protein
VNVSFFDLLGIDRSVIDRAGAAAALWPNSLASLTPGFNLSDDSLTIVNNLDSGTTFTNVRPGVDPQAKFHDDKGKPVGSAGQIAFACDMAIVGAPATTQPFYLRALPDLGILLKVTDPMHPARVFFAVDGRGHELIIDRLPVTLSLKAGLASALTSSPMTVGTFDGTAIDTFAYKLVDDAHPAQIECFVRLQLTVEGDVILEPTVPISFGPCRWMGLPAKAVYDIALLPSPNRRDYLEWTHNDPGSFISNPPAKGAIAFRSIDLDFSQPPFSDLRTRLQTGAVHIDNLELVLEDVVVPISVPILPIPSHGTFGFRRMITDRSDIGQAYSLSLAPVQIPVYGSDQQGGSGGSSLKLQVEKFYFQTGDVNAIDPADQPQVQFQAELIFQTTTGQKIGPTMGIDDEWTFTAGMVLDPATTPVKFTIADTTVGLVGFKFGISVGKLGKGIEFKDSFEALVDLMIQGPKSQTSSSSAFKIVSLTGKPLSVVLKDLGWKLGHFSLDGLQMPDGMQLVFANIVYVIIEEMGWVEEPNGTPYFSFSGGIAIGKSGGTPSQPSGNASDKDANGFGIRVRRLRFRLNDDDSQPLFKIDGVFLKLKYGPVDIEGFGYISDLVDTGWAVKEWGFGVKVALNLAAMQFSLAAMFVKGSRRNIADPSQEFDYFLAALELGFLPAGPIGLYDIRALVAYNMAPNLDSTFPDGEGMALLKWHQNHDHALSMPANRTLADWLAEKDSDAMGVGCGFSLNGCGSAMHLTIFIFVAKSNADSGILIVGELYLLKNPKPIAFVAIEYDWDKDKFGVMVGVDLNLGDFASGSLPDWLAHIASLTGTIYFGNQPWTFAIGQLADQSTWLSLQMKWDIWLVIKFLLGVCVQIVDGGPKGFGLVITLSASADWGIGKFLLWGSLGLIIGTWKTGSDASGLEFWIELGFKINLFWIFSFGAEISLRVNYLGKHPWYMTLHAEIKIDTPWFLPDVTFTIDKTWQEALPFDTSTTTQCLTSASGIDPTAQKEQPLLAPGLAGALGDASFVYTFNQLNGLQGTRIADTHMRDDIPIISVDSTIAVNLSQPVSNDSAIATSTYEGDVDTGVQKVQDITVRYGFKSIAVRRAPRFGPTAGTWTDFVTDAQTQFTIGGTAPETLTFAWDIDSRADGKLAPKRQLINSSAPYSFATQGAQNDEEAVRNDPDFPCCDERAQRQALPKPHVLEFSGLAIGSRTSRAQRFTGDGGALWVWALATTPAVAAGDPVYPGGHVARVSPRFTTMLGAVDLADPALSAELECSWEAFPGKLFFEAYDGTTLVAQQTADLHASGNTTLTVTVAAATSRGVSRLVLRMEIDDKAAFDFGDGLSTHGYVGGSLAQAALAGISVFRIGYVSLHDALTYVGTVQRCKSGAHVGPPGSDASGKLAFLPNHDYEVVVTSSIAVGTKDQGTRTLELSEAFYFRTKGLPGLNACANTGDDIRLHVDTVYPIQRAIPLYRQEPCVLAFENSLSSVLPIDRTPAAGDPPEKAQMFPLELNVDRVVSLSGLKRLTVPVDDWIASHRANPYPSKYRTSAGFAKSKVRQARSHDPLVVRYETVRAAVPACGTPQTDHASQVLLHEPIDETGAAGPWEPTTGYRATVRQQGGPFTERSGFDIYDLGAFIRQADGTAPATLWFVDTGGNLVAPAASTGRFYATCGEPNWDHLQAHSRIDLRSANAGGIAVGVADGTPVPQAMIATVERDGTGHSLVVRLRDASGEHELGRASVTISGLFSLNVIAYDDVVRASVGEVSVEGARGAVREGRVALVADGPAAFAGIAVGALDIYSFDFVTSKYNSFSEHLGSYDGRLGSLMTGAFGGSPTPIATVLASHGAEIPVLMQASADPQERQKLFDAVVSALGLGVRKNPAAVSIARVNDTNGTFGLLIESPEPISLTRDVALALSRHVRVWVPGTIFPTPKPPMVLAAPKWPVPGRPVEVAATVFATLRAPGETITMDTLSEALESLTFTGKKITLPPTRTSSFGAGDRIVRVIAGSDGNEIEVYDATTGALSQTLSVAQAKQEVAFGSVANLGAGSIAVLHPGGATGPIHYGHWQDEDIPVLFVALSNGDETKILIFSQDGSPLAAGNYTVRFVLDRDRWSASTQADPEQHYHDERAIPLQW